VQAEIIRFEDAVIAGGPLVLPGTLDLIKQVSLCASVLEWLASQRNEA
jgi:hypothetical protein